MNGIVQSETDETTKKIIEWLYENNNTINSKKKDEKINLKKDDKYYFKIISLDEYNEGKTKKKQKKYSIIFFWFNHFKYNWIHLTKFYKTKTKNFFHSNF